MKRMIKRGEIYYADLNPFCGSEQGGIRPVVILQNNIGNRYSPTVVIAPITSRLDKRPLPTHIQLCSPTLIKDSLVLLEQIRAIDKRRLGYCVGMVDKNDMQKIEGAVGVSLGISFGKE